MFYLLFDNNIMENIIKCKEMEAKKVLGKEWPLFLDKFEAFTVFYMYALIMNK